MGADAIDLMGPVTPDADPRHVTSTRGKVRPMIETAPFGRYMRDAKTYEIAGGSSEILKNTIGRYLERLGAPPVVVKVAQS